MIGQVISLEAATGIIPGVLAWRIWRLFRPGSSRLDHPLIFFLLIFPAMLVLRLPQMGWAREINVDESQMLAQGMRYLSHPVPWRDVDGTTGGPLDSWLLSAPILLGAPVSWATARAVLWAANCATLVFLYLALRCFGTRPEAQIALMPTVFFYAFARDPDFIHYSSETLPVLLLSVMVWLLCRAWVTEKFSNGSVFFTGFLAGCIPFAKLQASPLAGYLLALGLAQIIFQHPGNRWRKAGLLCLGALFIPAFLLGVVTACGAGNDFWKSYILAAAAYTHETMPAKMDALWTLFTSGANFQTYLDSGLAGGILLLVAWSRAREPKPGSKLLWPLAVNFGFGVLAVLCMLAAGKASGHYLLLLVPALGIFFGLAFAVGRTLLLSKKETDPHPFPKPIHWFRAGFALIICLQAGNAPAYFKATRTLVLRRPPEGKSFLARQILKASQPGDTLSVWGWMPSYYVETGLMPATRDTIGHFIIEPGPYRDYYQHRYLTDLKRNPPAIFMDAVADGAPAPQWAKLTPHESFPALAKFIEEKYSPWLSVHVLTAHGAGAPTRIYLLKQRMEELNLTPEELTIPADPLLAPE